MAMKTRYTIIDGEVIAEKRGGVRKQYVPDPLGSTVALLDNTQAQTDIFTYWPYGEENSRTGTTATPLRFVGTKGYYQNTTTTYAEGRILSPLLSRWIDADIMGSYEEGFSFNLYAGDNPTTLYGQVSTLAYIGHVPPGVRLRPGDIGDSDCNLDPIDVDKPWQGTCYSIIDSSKCYAKCIDAHEGQHRYDDKKCCAAAAKCMKNSPHPIQKLQCGLIYLNWVNATRSRSECQAYQNELECEKQMSRDLNCLANPTNSCCKSLASRQRKVTKTFIPRWCGTTLWPRGKPVACKFPR